jgi:hypothetical protein
MDMEDEPKETIGNDDVINEIKQGLLHEMAAIFNRANRNDRQITEEEAKMLRELTTVYVIFCRLHKPDEKVVWKTKVIMPKDPPWLLEELRREEEEKQAQESIT